MGRTKVNMELITKDKNRKTTYENRKNGIIKKAKELSVLCDVNTAIIIHPPPDSSNRLEIWPENPDQIKTMITSYKNNENGKRVMYDVKDYFQSRNKKIKDELVRTRENNMEARYPTWFQDLNHLSEEQLRLFATGLEAKKNIVKAHLQVLKKRYVNVQIENGPSNHYVGSYPNLDQVPDLMSHQLGWFNDAPKMQTPVGFEIGYNQPEPTNHRVGSNPIFDQVDQDSDDDELMSHLQKWFADPKNMRMALEFVLETNQLPEPANLNVGSVDQVQADSISHDLGWLECAPTTSFTLQKPAEMGSGFDHPGLEDDVVYDNLKQCCRMPEELALQENSHVNVGGLEDIVIYKKSL